jgi:hypothetical protein
VDAAVIPRLAKQGLGGTTDTKAPTVKVEVRAVEGEAGIGAIVGIVEDPLSQRTHDREPGLALGHEEALVGTGEPVRHVAAFALDVCAQTATQIAGERTPVREDLEATEEVAQLIVAIAQEVLADVLGKVKVTSQHRDLPLAHEVARGLDDGPAEVAHDGTGNDAPAACP